MTITFLAPDGVAVTAQQERQARAAQHGGGAARPLGGRSGFRVDTASNILTATSTTWSLQPCSAMIDPGASTHQGMYGWSSDQVVSRAEIVAADATYARKDIVYIQINDSSAGDGSGATTAPLVYLAGTASANPDATKATLPSSRCFLVGTITVPQAGGGSPSVIINPARYVTAGGILPVADDTERLALAAYKGLRVDQADTGRAYRHNGTRWAQAALAAIGSGSLGAVATLAGTPTWTDIVTVTATSMGGPVTIDFNTTLINANSGDHRTAAVRVQCDGVDVDSYSFFAQYLAGASVPTFPAQKFFHTPAAGQHTWTLQGNANIGGAIQAVKGSMVIYEKP
ncbi:hypothetical protein [Arthrobacter sp. PsM3]|uniref:hypothetical protein n=1 Tax=Arthrobacter sp. PsM3 TaxID=3030531 RepID=UPI00263B4863|nr:hypothetical protein [Arthrobacter sp. PsM3]MDN4646464.1 hypothetical protein [Arthrobacter sp. PsM3]